MTVLLWVLGVLALLLVGWLVVTYNRLVHRRNRVDEAWSGMDVQLQRRADLVPNLVSTVQAYAGHEEQLFATVAEARAALVRASGPREAAVADERMEQALGRVFAVAESYPELRASENYLALQRELSMLEEELSLARRYHNAVVADFNTSIQSFPSVLVAGPLGFTARESFRAHEEARAVPDVGGTR